MRRRGLPVLLLLLMALQPLSPLVGAWTDEGAGEVGIGEGDTEAPLALLAKMEIEPVADLAHGWGKGNQDTIPVMMAHRTAVPVPIADWTADTGERSVSGWVILQHTWPVPTQWRGELAAGGIECHSFLPPAAFNCYVPDMKPTELAKLDVSAAMYLDPTDKIRPSLVSAMLGINPTPYADKDQATIQVVLSGETLPEVSNVIIHSHSGRFATVTANSLGLAELAYSGEVEWLEQKLAYQLMNDVADSVIKSDWVASSSNMQGLDATWGGLDGTGIIVTVGDSGIDTGVNNSGMHGDFRDHFADILSWPIPQSLQSTCSGNGGVFDDGASDGNGHGTHVAGSVLGDGTQSTGQIKGSAPEARLLFHSVGQVCNSVETLKGIPDDFGDMVDLAAANGSLVHTNSWGVSSTTYPAMAGEYDSGSMQADVASTDHPLVTVLFSAGNDGVDGDSDGEVDLGALGPSGSAKNVLTVGASENNRPSKTTTWNGGWPGDFPQSPIDSDLVADDVDGMAGFSSRGPVDDTRIKPDISAPGTFILSTKSSVAGACSWGAYTTNTEYCYMGGTSMATPLTAGSVALLLQHLIDNLGHTTPSSALVKAILTANADDMAGQYATGGSGGNGAAETVPNNHEGWGRLNLQSAMSTSFIDGEGVSTSDQRKFSFVVPVAAPDLRLMLSWSDPASTPAASVNLVNDLDLAVKSPTGVTTTISNDRDNLVGHIITSPSAGTWEVHITGTSVPNGPQLFALALSANYTLTNMTQDADLDGVEDSVDDCPSVSGTSTVDRLGCPDTDTDGYSDADALWTIGDGADAFPSEPTQWADADSDGYGDNPAGVTPDACTAVPGTSTVDRFGCLDTDGDGLSDPVGPWTTAEGADACLNDVGTSTMDRNGCPDSDGDGYSDPDGLWTVVDGADAFPSDDEQWADSDSDGFGDNPPPANNGDDCPAASGTSSQDRVGCPDADGDGWSDPDGSNQAHPTGTADAFPGEPTQWQDTDSDGYGDNPAGVDADDCPTIYGTSTATGGLGCPDTDSDGYPDSIDAFPSDPTQWADTDGDGYGDEPTGFQGDDCVSEAGDSFKGGTFGCPDSDRDGWADSEDDFPDQLTQWTDTDGDGFGDNPAGYMADDCPSTPGTSTIDKGGCPDADSDGWSDDGDDFDAEPTQWLDTDGDGRGDNPQPALLWDDCPLVYGDSSQDRIACADTDGDGYSDPDSNWNWSDGADAFPADLTRWIDDDQDGYDDGIEDDCITTAGNSTTDRIGCPDTDGDGYSDADAGWTPTQGADAFPNEPSQWSDADADGYGDDATGVTPDGCTSLSGNSTLDRFGCPDSDADGWSDADATFLAHPAGNADAFPNEATQWEDADGDGFGDNLEGASADDCPVYAGTSTVDFLGCPDSDGDGVSDPGPGYTIEDGADAWKDDPTQWVDSDGDGYGDNPNGTQGDYCPNIAGISTGGNFFGCMDADGDTWGDPYDSFPDEPSQWLDQDGDGYGDNVTKGALLIDHWTSDPSRNVAEVSLSCTPATLQTELYSIEEASFDCTVSNQISFALMVVLEWDAPAGMSRTLTRRAVDLGASGSPTGTATVTFTGRAKQAGSLATSVIAIEPGGSEMMAFSNVTFTVSEPAPVKWNTTGTNESNESGLLEEFAFNPDDPMVAIPGLILILIGLALVIRGIIKGRKKNSRWIHNEAAFLSRESAQIFSDAPPPFMP